MNWWKIVVFLCGGMTASAFAQPSPAPSTSKATLLVTGLHCPPCTRTVESGLLKTPGVKAAKVDWRTKNGSVEFDESKVSVHELIQRIAATPHMMGRGKYGAWLALPAEDVADPQVAGKIKAHLKSLEGVQDVVVYPKQGKVAVALKPKGKLSLPSLKEELARAVE